MNLPVERVALEGLVGQYLAFQLGAQEYGIPILAVHEIIGLLPITPVPQAPAAIRGVINLRGKIVPVVDLRVRFDISPAQAPELCIVVVRTADRDMGVLVDAVSEVVLVRLEEIAALPELGSSSDGSYVRGIHKANGRIRFLLNIEEALRSFDAPPVKEDGSIHTQRDLRKTA